MRRPNTDNILDLGSISQSITYPFDVLRRKMQVSGLKSLGPGYDSAFDAIRYIFKTEGVVGFYRGLWPNLLKVAPSIATSCVPLPRLV
jgi:solute carrier family 25 phosphate transporter 23/24/25/41